jgi:hypothetical protein
VSVVCDSAPLALSAFTKGLQDVVASGAPLVVLLPVIVDEAIALAERQRPQA